MCLMFRSAGRGRDKVRTVDFLFFCFSVQFDFEFLLDRD